MHHLTFSPFVLELYQNASTTTNNNNNSDDSNLTTTLQQINARHDILQRTDARDDFSVSIPITDATRFSNFDASPTPPSSSSSSSRLDLIRQDLANAVAALPTLPSPIPPIDNDDYPVTSETVAHWRFHDGQANNQKQFLQTDTIVQDISGNGNHLMLQTLLEDGTTISSNATTNEYLQWSDDHHPLSSSPGSICFRNPHRYLGSFLTTMEEGASIIEATTFTNGYTIETFVKMLDSWSPDQNRWTAMIAKRGEGRHADHHQALLLQGDTDEPLAFLGLSASREFQWASFAGNNNNPNNNDTVSLATAWSAPQPRGEWIHVAAVNDGRVTTLYVEGTPARRDPVHYQTTAGIAMAMAATEESSTSTTRNNGWNVGASTYHGSTKVFGNGCIGEVRMVQRALTPQEFLLARRKRDGHY
jgi:Concanavalin A-like lectin/glucanases superfamily